MRADEIITFRFAGYGTVRFTVEKCRRICPEATARLEQATEEMAAAEAREGVQGLVRAAPKVGEALDALKDTIVARGRHLRQEMADADDSNQSG